MAVAKMLWQRRVERIKTQTLTPLAISVRAMKACAMECCRILRCLLATTFFICCAEALDRAGAGVSE